MGSVSKAMVNCCVCFLLYFFHFFQVYYIYETIVWNNVNNYVVRLFQSWHPCSHFGFDPRSPLFGVEVLRWCGCFRSTLTQLFSSWGAIHCRGNRNNMHQHSKKKISAWTLTKGFAMFTDVPRNLKVFWISMIWKSKNIKQLRFLLTLDTTKDVGSWSMCCCYRWKQWDAAKS